MVCVEVIQTIVYTRGNQVLRWLYFKKTRPISVSVFAAVVPILNFEFSQTVRLKHKEQTDCEQHHEHE